MSLWWSFTLTAFGAAGIFLTYRSYTAYLGPAIGISIQLVWVAYALASQQWWFIVSALLYGGSHLYGIRKRRRERAPRSIPAGQCVEVVETPTVADNFDPPPYVDRRFEPDLNLVGNLEGSQREIRRVRKFIQKGLNEPQCGRWGAVPQAIMRPLPTPPPPPRGGSGQACGRCHEGHHHGQD